MGKCEVEQPEIAIDEWCRNNVRLVLNWMVVSLVRSPLCVITR